MRNDLYDELRKTLYTPWNPPAPKKTLKLPLKSAVHRPAASRLATELFTKKKVFVSFDYENDRHYKRLLEAWSANSRFTFVFQDHSSSEINSWNIARIKAGLTTKINTATHTLVIIGKEANKLHADYLAIGSRNWINFEIKQSKLSHNRLVAVKLNRLYGSPEEMIGAGASWAMSFTEESIINALQQAK